MEKTASFRTISTIVSITALALFSGIVGGVMSQQYFDARFEELKRLSLQEIIRPQAPKNKDVGEIADSISKSIVRVIGSTQKAGQENTPHYGIVLSSDGWVVTTGNEAEVKKSSIIDDNGKQYPILRTVLDDATGLIFAKVDAHSLKTVSLESTPRYSTTNAFVFFDKDIVSKIPISPLRYPTNTVLSQAPLSSDIFSKMYSSLPYDSAAGLPAVSDAEEIIGIGTGSGIIPSTYIRTIIQSIIEKGIPGRPRLSLSYIDTSTQDASVISKKGAVLTTERKNIITDKGTISLQKGDTITDVNGEALDQNRNLTELIEQYRPGEKISITVTKTNGAIMVYKITL